MAHIKLNFTNGYVVTTNVENNIKMNFNKYVKRFVNSSFKKQNNKLIDECEKGLRKR
jgi:hypothetical protein